MRRTAIVGALGSLALVAGLMVGAPVAANEAPASASPRWTLEESECTRKALAKWDCYTLTVPLDWDNLDDTRTASIAMAVKPATGRTRDRIGALTFNPGGPGSDALSSAAGIYRELPAEIRQRFDFVAWDPRGVGASRPQLRGCGTTPPPEPPDPYVPPATGPVDWKRLTVDTADAFNFLLSECYAANPDVAPYLGTWQVIHDLEAMRQALGEKQWTYWGMSYGTRIGYWYAREFPTRLRALVLDGSWPANMGLRTWAGMDTWSWAYTTEEFASLFGKKMPAKFNRVLTALNSRTFTDQGGTVYSRWQALPLIYSQISYQGAYPDIVKAINGAYDALFPRNSAVERRGLRKLERALERLEEAQDPSAGFVLQMVNCADMDARPSLDSVAAMAESAAANNSVFAGTLVIQKGTACAGLPESMVRKPANLTRPYSLPTPPVIINSVGDSRTPWWGGKQMSGYLAGSTFITYGGTQHVTYLQTPSTCVNDLVTRYFLSLQAPGGAVSCAYARLPRQ
jgi:pimeloyl-ACP methyl ester carboxylesterase